jgi:hypothetical protein
MDYLGGISTPDLGNFGFALIFKILFAVLFACYVLYSFFLTLRVRILAETVDTPLNKKVLMLSYAHIGIVLVGGLIALMLILVA